MPRVSNQTVIASPATNGSTKIAEVVRLTLPAGVVVDLEASVDMTIGATGTAVTLTLRRGGSASSPVVGTFGPFTVAAGNRVNLAANTTDQQDAEIANIGYNLTCQVTGASAQSTINGVYVMALW